MHYLEVDAAVPLVRRYYDEGKGAFTGRRFDTLGGGGNRKDVANTFTAEDLVAVSLLSVSIPGSAAIAILEDDADELSEGLSKIPNGLALWEADDDVINKTSQANSVYQMLVAIHGIAYVTANKLLARKRPLLLPVYDSIVKKALQPRKTDFWIPLRESLRANDSEVLEALTVIREEAGLSDEVSLLRVLDVAVWMAARKGAMVTAPRSVH